MNTRDDRSDVFGIPYKPPERDEAVAQYQRRSMNDCLHLAAVMIDGNGRLASQSRCVPHVSRDGPQVRANGWSMPVTDTAGQRHFGTELP